MQRGLTTFLLAVIALSVVGGIGASFFWKQDKTAVEPFMVIAPIVAAVAIQNEPLQVPEEVDKALAADVSELTPPTITFLEYPGRLVALEGAVSTAEERRTLQKILGRIYSKGTKFDNQLQLDRDRELFSWLKALAEIDLSGLHEVWELKCELSNSAFKVSGKVASQAVGKRLLKTLASTLPEGVKLSNELEAGDQPKPSISVWMAPGMTYLLTGSLPESMIAEMLTLVKRAVPAGALVIDDLVENRFVQQPTWKEELTGFLPRFLKETQRSVFRISSASEVKVEGIATGTAIPGIRRRLLAAFPSNRFKVETDLQLGVSSGKQIGVGKVKLTIQELISSSKILFRSGRSRVSQLSTGERAKLDQIGQQWRNENFDQKVYVFGFTDASGDRETNAYVSSNRCSNVVLYLTKNFGIDKSYFEVMGLPDDYEPDPDLSSDELRRVEFSLTDKPTAGGNSEASDAQPKTLLKPVTLEDLLVSNIVYFTRRQVTPSKTDRRKIADLGSALVLSGTTDNVVLYGYSDGRGKAADNRWLVEECCRAVAKILRSSGIPDSQIIIRPVVKPKSADGAENVETKPIREDDSVPPMPEENPRRVELKLEPPVINEKNSDEDSVSPVPDVST